MTAHDKKQKTIKNQIDVLNRTAWETMIENPRKALETAREALETSAAIEYQEGIAESSLNMGWCHSYLAEYDKALSWLDSALDIYRQRGDPEGEMKSLNAKGVVHFSLGSHDRALEFYGEALRLSEEHRNKERQLAVLNNIGEIFWERLEHDKALSYFAKALDIAERLDDKEKIGNILVNLGIAQRKTGEYSKALESLNRALAIGTELKDWITSAQCLNHIGLIQGELGNTAVAEAQFMKSIEMSSATGDKICELEATMNLGALRAECGEPAEAISLVKSSLDLALAVKAKTHATKACRHLATLYQSQRKYKEALHYYRMYVNIHDELGGEEMEKKLRSISMKNEIERAQREAEIYRLKNVDLKKKSKELESSLSILRTLNEIGKEITASLDMQVLLDTVYQRITRLMETTIFGIAIYMKEERTLDYRLFIEDGKPIPRFTVNVDDPNSFGAYVVREKQEIVLNDVEAEYHRYIQSRNAAHGKKAKALAYFPLMIKGDLIGVMTVQSSKDLLFDQQRVDTLRILASYVAIALENSLIHERLRTMNEIITREKSQLQEAYEQIAHMANHDNLTGLPNRRLFFEFLMRAIEQAKRKKRILAVFFIDMDDFKPINDLYGHDIGDEVLKITSKRFTNTLRSVDMVARFGGDEFVVLLSDLTDGEGAEKVAQKLIEALNEPIDVRGTRCRIGASLGIALYPDDDATAEGLVKKADNAMYRIKTKGKNGYSFSQKDDPLAS